MKIMINRVSGDKENVPEGFSFTTLFFGVFVPLFRGDYLGFLVMFIFAIFTGGLSWIVFPFFYNSMYQKHLKKNGYSDEN